MCICVCVCLFVCVCVHVHKKDKKEYLNKKICYFLLPFPGFRRCTRTVRHQETNEQ